MAASPRAGDLELAAGLWCLKSCPCGPFSLESHPPRPLQVTWRSAGQLGLRYSMVSGSVLKVKAVCAFKG